MKEIKRKKLSKEERIRIYNKCNHRCAYCGCDLEYKDMQVDHAQPLRCGGADEMGNMLPACRSCNHYKATLTVEKYRKYIESVPDRLNRDSIPFTVGKRFGIIEEKRRPILFWYEEMKIEL